MKAITDLDYDELVTEVTEKLGWEKYRADQISDWIYNKKVSTFSDMTNLSKEQRKILDENYFIEKFELLDKQVSKKDRTTKFLWKLSDGNTVESVLLFYKNRIAACISTQVGCPIGCKFCATGLSGYVRNLSVSEIVAQILHMEREEKVRIGNVVYMGMGEPFLNYNNVIKSIKILNNKKMLNIGVRHITVSTVGIPDKIVLYAKDGMKSRLAISLHSSYNSKRDKIVPINIKYPIEEVVQAAKEYQEITGNRVSIEYIMIREFNDYDADALKLVEVLKGLRVFVNLIPVNP
ncbi:MAG: 23S rRNA (adenine(2503)-C(2))-methyltransferase RlmN, partial [Thermotogaceae bacterium]|nr:23S rRNA (adenine(2503)-C(2))-methyltransferase RlmN [Thermotogaceae bacterium]